MKNNKKILFLAMAAIQLLTVVELRATEIRQELYEFQMNITQATTSLTFVITEDRGINSASKECYHLPKIYFELGSAVLSPSTAKTLLASMKSHGITHHTPLIISGYSCELGSERFNLILSHQRAVAVVSFLESHGFTATTLQAKGETDPITTDPQELFKNRRVEITIN